MLRIPENENNLQSLQDQINELKRSEYKYELRINEYEQEKKWTNDLMANSNLSCEQKVVLNVIRQIIRRVRYDLSEPVHIWIGEIANRTGLGESSVRRITDKLNEMGLITKDTRGKGKGQRTWFSLDTQIRNSSTLISVPARNHGGARKKCEKCGSENIDIYTAYECRDCGHIHQVDIEHQFKNR